MARSSLLTDRRRKGGFLSLAAEFVWFNPHLTLSFEWPGEDAWAADATDPEWRKWRPDMPTSPHWWRER